MTTRNPVIRAGIGGWTYEPWRGLFYPKGLPHASELRFASRALPSIEVNGTFYRTQTPATFAKWRDETPEGFVFSIKAPRAAVMKRVLAEAGPAVERFMASGISRLGGKLGPILWQFAPAKKFDGDDMAAFLALLPREAGGHPLRHALEARHESFRTPAFTDLAAKAGAAIVLADSDDYPLIDEPTAGFVYARLMKARADEETGYAPAEIAAWRQRAEGWAAGGRDVFVYFIDGAKKRAPAAAQAFLAGL